ncbi:hypothetical protein AMTR_s00162p00038390 [Amborella trichopoda]|uniref:Uncharacterized protein n=1 Tax=Amborella trichopoda TaxID=13333 RepID=W1PNP7_AMBTC|nr:hypothetical protein AMTR_s00162p00038390 [Amborella trichopoda]
MFKNLATLDKKAKTPRHPLGGLPRRRGPRPPKRCLGARLEVHTKKRNKLEQKRVKDLVFVQHNQKMQQRHQELKHNVREVDDMDDTSEWIVDGREDEVIHGEGLTWGQGREALGTPLSLVH